MKFPLIDPKKDTLKELHPPPQLFDPKVVFAHTQKQTKLNQLLHIVLKLLISEDRLTFIIQFTEKLNL